MTASFHEVQFPPDISNGASGGPTFHTTVLTLASGAEKRNIDWSKARATYDVAHGLKTQAQLDALLDFFRARRGRAYGFRFKDWTDYRLASTDDYLPVLMTTNNVQNSFQLQKIYGDAGSMYVRDIIKPVAGTLTILENGVATHDFSVNTVTGIVTLGPALASTTGHVLTGNCEFDVPCRFDTDEMRVSIDEYDVFTWGQVPIIEIRDT